MNVALHPVTDADTLLVRHQHEAQGMPMLDHMLGGMLADQFRQMLDNILVQRGENNRPSENSSLSHGATRSTVRNLLSEYPAEAEEAAPTTRIEDITEQVQSGIVTPTGPIDT